MAKRLNIVNNVKAAYRDVYVFRKDILKISWFVILLILIYRSCVDYIFYPYLRHHFPDYFVKNYDHFYFDYIERISYFFDDPMEAILSIAIFRKFILNESFSFRLFEIKKGGLYEDKVIAELPVYFSFGKKEVIYASWQIILGSLYFFIWQFSLFSLLHYQFQKWEPIYPHFSREFQIGYSILYWGKSPFSEIFYAPLILLWPYLSLEKQFKFSVIHKLIGPIRGNIWRTAFIGILIYFPYHVMAFAQSYIQLHFENSNFENAENFVYFNLHEILFFICDFAWIIFAANTYKNLMPLDLANNGDRAD